MSVSDLIITIAIVILANIIQTIVIYRFAATRNWPAVFRSWLENDNNKEETERIINILVSRATETENIQRAIDTLINAAAETIKMRIIGAVGGTMKALNRAVQKEALALAREGGIDVEPAIAVERAVETLQQKNPLLASLAQAALSRMISQRGGGNGSSMEGWG